MLSYPIMGDRTLCEQLTMDISSLQQSFIEVVDEEGEESEEASHLSDLISSFVGC